jgi:hypothetical protein
MPLGFPRLYLGGMRENSPAIYRWVSECEAILSRRDGRTRQQAFFRPFRGLERSLYLDPSDKSLGYFRPSLWDWDGHTSLQISDRWFFEHCCA